MTAASLQPAAYEGDMYRLLMEQVIAGNGLAGVVHSLSDLAGLPAAVADEELHPLHAFAPGGRVLPPAQSVMSGVSLEAVRFDVTREPQASTSPPARRVTGEMTTYAVAPVVLSSGVIGYVWVSGTLSPWCEEAVSHAAAACAVEMLRQRALVEGESRVRSSFLEDLLLGTITSTTATRRRAKFLGYELRGEQVVFILDMDDFMGYVTRRGEDEGGIQRIKERFRRAVDACIPAMWNKNLLWEHSDSIVILAPAGKGYNTGAFARRVELLRQQVEEKLGGPSISAGIGRPYADLTRLKGSYAEAEHALKIGAAVSGPAATATFGALGAYRLLYYLRDQPELHRFCDEVIGELVRYDDKHDSHLVDTLTTFLELQGNLSQAARALHLHRNGLLYRIGRIETIAGCDLNDSSQRLALQLALLARPLVWN